MRQILVDAARRRQAEKRGGGEAPATLGEEVLDTRASETLALHEALEDLERMDPRKHRVVELKYFGGATVQEIAAVLEMAPRTVERDLRLARAFLAEALGEGG
jgi:RNA polymerase sigma factor (TIGR02999 family)